MRKLCFSSLQGLVVVFALALPAFGQIDHALDPSVKVTRLHSFANDVLNTFGTYSGYSPSAPPMMASDGYLYGMDTWGGNSLPWLQAINHYTYKMRPAQGAYAARNSVVNDSSMDYVSVAQGAVGQLTERNGVLYGTLTGEDTGSRCDWEVSSNAGIFRLGLDYDPSIRLPLGRELLPLPEGFAVSQTQRPGDFVNNLLTSSCAGAGATYNRFNFVPVGALTLDDSDQMLYGVDDGPVKRVFRIDLADHITEFWRLPESYEGRHVRPASIRAHEGKLYLLVHLEKREGDETTANAPSGLLYQLNPQAPANSQEQANPLLLHRFVWPEGRILQAQSEHLRYWRHETAGARNPGDIRMATPDTIALADDPKEFIWRSLPSATHLVSGDDGWLYGNARDGGDGFGTLWRIRTDGSGFQVLHRFSGPDGDSPIGPLALMNGYVYGTTQHGGLWRCVPPDTRIPVLMVEALAFMCTNAPYGNVGDAKQGYGTLFRISTGDNGGLVETRLYNFNHAGGGPEHAADATGSWPVGLTAGSDGHLYGATRFGGYYLSFFATGGAHEAYRNATNGTLFQVDLDALVPTGSVQLSVMPTDGVLMLGESATFSWQGANVSNCQADGGLAGQPWRKALETSGTDVITPHFPGLGNYLVYCNDDLRPGVLVSASVELRIIGPRDVVVTDDRLNEGGSGAISGLLLVFFFASFVIRFFSLCCIFLRRISLSQRLFIL